VLKLLHRHPFPVVARFERVVAVSFAFPKAVFESLVPPGLELDTYEGFGFVTAALVWTRQLRPAAMPAFLGQDFFLAGYRVFTRLCDHSGRRVRGLKIIRSETDSRRMVRLGNVFTGYRYRLASVRIDMANGQTRVVTKLPDGRPTLDLSFQSEREPSVLPSGSPFTDWKTARRFAGPMPFTFSPEKDGSFIVIEGRRSEWKPRPVAVSNWKVGLFEEPPFDGITPLLANAFEVDEVDYRWERGRVVRPMPSAT
jgi:uncharacterized protein YqjF (DUF2071 family)